MAQKKIIQLCIVIVLISSIVVGIFFAQTDPKRYPAKNITVKASVPTPTKAQATVEIINNSLINKNVKHFIGQKYKFSFSYPSDWQFLDEPNVSGVEIQKIDKQGKGFSISIRIIDNPQKLSLEEFARNQVYSANDAPKKVVVGELTGYELQHLPDGLLTNIYLPYDDKGVLNIFAGGEFENNKQTLQYYQQTIDTFLSSFKVL